jgi:hypothetical protein
MTIVDPVATAETEIKLDLAFRLRRALCAISEKRPSVERARLDSFLRFISTSPSILRAKGVDFPYTIRRHPNSPERTMESSKATILYFHVGNAILAFYDYINATKNIDLSPAQVEEFEVNAGARVQLLECIARIGLDQCRISGDDLIGRSLVF